MKGNSTDTGDTISWANPEVLVPFITSFISIAGTLGVIAYLKFKQQFSDEQTTDIALSTITHSNGNRETKIEINLKNDERYAAEFTAAANIQETTNNEGLSSRFYDWLSGKQNNSNTASNSQSTSGLSAMTDSMQRMMDNNNKGDEIIGETRNHVARDALNAFLKIVQVYALGSNPDAVLNINSLHSHVDDIFSIGGGGKRKQATPPQKTVVVLDPNDSRTKGGMQVIEKTPSQAAGGTGKKIDKKKEPDDKEEELGGSGLSLRTPIIYKDSDGTTPDTAQTARPGEKEIKNSGAAGEEDVQLLSISSVMVAKEDEVEVAGYVTINIQEEV